MTPLEIGAAAATAAITIAAAVNLRARRKPEDSVDGSVLILVIGLVLVGAIVAAALA